MNARKITLACDVVDENDDFADLPQPLPSLQPEHCPLRLPSASNN
jgi:hypothetical protein